MLKSITKLANEFGTDKGTQIAASHGYSLIYELLFAPLRHLPRVDILEMGLARGGPEVGGQVNRKIAGAPSLDTWLSYFQNSHVVGFDISDFSEIRHERFTFFRGDSGRLEDVQQLRSIPFATTNGETDEVATRLFDIIIDDASHASYHQQLGLSVLFDSLKPGGIYVIEDLGWQPESIERDLPSVPLTSDLLTRFSASGIFPTTAAIPADAARMLEREISCVCMFDESLLNAMGDSYNRRFNLPKVLRSGWRGKRGVIRMLDPYFWLYSVRRFRQSLVATEFTNHQSVKLAILQRI